MNSIKETIEEKGQSLTDQIYEFLENVKPNHAILFFLASGIISGILLNGYIVLKQEDVSLLLFGLFWMSLSIVLTGLLIMHLHSSKLSVNFLFKLVLIFFVGFAVEYQVAALYGVEGMKPIIGATSNVQEYVLGWGMFLFLIFGGVIFCLVMNNEDK